MEVEATASERVQREKGENWGKCKNKISEFFSEAKQKKLKVKK
jgi:hypothetical protein